MNGRIMLDRVDPVNGSRRTRDRYVTLVCRQCGQTNVVLYRPDPAHPLDTLTSHDDESLIHELEDRERQCDDFITRALDDWEAEHECDEADDYRR